MKNLDQKRAANAIEWASKIPDGEGGSKAIAKKVTAQIMQNGFLGAMAFALEDGNAYLVVFQGIINHLNDCGLMYGITSTTPKEFFKQLCEDKGDDDASLKLRAITEEAMAYLAYLRRFAS